MREKLHRERQVLSAKAKHPVENVKEKPKKKIQASYIQKVRVCECT